MNTLSISKNQSCTFPELVASLNKNEAIAIERFDGRIKVVGKDCDGDKWSLGMSSVARAFEIIPELMENSGGYGWRHCALYGNDKSAGGRAKIIVSVNAKLCAEFPWQAPDVIRA